MYLESEGYRMAKAKTIEDLARQIFLEAKADGEPVTEAEALEMAKMEMGAEEIKNYTQASPERKAKKPRERKVDNEKKFILEECAEMLSDLENASDITLQNETDVHFTYNGTSYSLKLIKHRNAK